MTTLQHSKISFTAPIIHIEEYINWISPAKKEETRINRIDLFIKKLLDRKKPDQK